MLYRTNILALVGGGEKPTFSPDKVMLWDDSSSKTLGELKFKTQVKAVKLSKTLVAAVLEDRIYVYQLCDLTMKDAIETVANPNGICVLNNNVLACPFSKQGEIRINHYQNNTVNNF